MYVAGTRKALDIPERAQAKTAVLSGKPVRCSVAIEQTSGRYRTQCSGLSRGLLQLPGDGCDMFALKTCDR
jgi:hypothetical protein